MGNRARLPRLFVEGKDDISVISSLLKRHGVDTQRGQQHLEIVSTGNLDSVLETIPDAIKVNTDRPVGFLVDIDIGLADRWSAVKAKIREVGIVADADCPKGGYFGKMPDYKHRFGVWLMPDCQTDHGKMENLIESLIPSGDPLWSVAKQAVADVPRIIDQANENIANESDKWKRYRDVDLIKSQVHTWIAWQRLPGAPLGAAINDRLLGADSPQAISLLKWLRDLYGLPELNHL